MKPTLKSIKLPIKLIILVLISIMVLIIFWNFLASISTSTLLKEGFDPSKPQPVTKAVSVTITDETTSKNQVDPNSAGTFFLTTEKDIGKVNIIKMGTDPSSINIGFNATENTKLLIYPTNMPQTNPHKANIFPVNFKVDISFPNSDENITTQYVDASGDTYMNALKYYVSPNGDVSGNFAAIEVAVPNVQTPIYINENSQIEVGTVQYPTKNNFSITVNQKGNTIKGIVMILKPPA